MKERVVRKTEKPEIGLSQLESHLWESANILRGPVDAADLKTYIFPLQFFKRISDVYDEEVKVALDEIRQKDFNLNIPRYVEPVIEEESITIEAAIANLRDSLQAAYSAENRLKALLQREGLLNHDH